MSDIVQKLWGFCHTLRHDGIDYGDYIEQITYLLFLKMADEREIKLPKECDWPSLREKSGTELTDKYADMLRTLGKSEGMLGDIYAGAQSRFNNPVNLKQLIAAVDELDWTALNVDVKAEAYEGLLEKAASEGKKGAGQYFTPRVLIQSIVRCMKPDPRKNNQFTICDPACGTGGFLVAAYEWLIGQTKGALDRETAKRVKRATYFGTDLVPRPRRLALMNLYLHGLAPEITLGDAIYHSPDSTRYDCILTNPPFGTKGANQAPDRDDFVVETSNKQLNFVQHVLTVLKPGGRAAIVLPDNCLFADQAGEIFKILTEDCNLHTVLRLPRGTFTPYSHGIKANVVFFSKGAPTETVWIYDARTNVPGITKKDRPLTAAYFTHFEECYGADADGRGNRTASTVDTKSNGEVVAGDRWRKFDISEVKERDFKLDGIKWLKEESLQDTDDLPEPEDLTVDAITQLEGAVKELNAFLALLETENGNLCESDVKAAPSIQPGNPALHVADDEVPEGWAHACLNELVYMAARIGWRGLKAEEYTESGPLFISVHSLNNGIYVDFGPAFHISHERYEESPEIMLRENDVVLTKDGAGIGKLGIVRNLPGKATINSSLLLIRSSSAFIPKFTFYILSGPKMQDLVQSRITGSATPHLFQRDIKQFDIAVPPLAEQKRIVAKIEALLSRLDKARGHVGAAAVRAEKLTQAILAKAFRGELVLTEAELARRERRDYEPATTLLERIRAEKEKANGKR